MNLEQLSVKTFTFFKSRFHYFDLAQGAGCKSLCDEKDCGTGDAGHRTPDV